MPFSKPPSVVHQLQLSADSRGKVSVSANMDMPINSYGEEITARIEGESYG